MRDGDILATVDMGSNSFRLEMARLDHGQLVRLDYYKEPVRLGAGLDENGYLTQASIDASVACLKRFSERLSGLRPTVVRAVATQSLRSAKNPEVFLAQAEPALGHPIEIISGQEEARLIYLGVSNDLPQDHKKRLVVDIGGGSTEMIIGVNTFAHRMESLRIGCVSHTLKFFPEGKVTTKAMTKGITAATALFEEVADAYGAHQWQVAYGSSGTIEAIAELCTELGEPPETITYVGMQKIVDAIAGIDVKKWVFNDLKPQRAQVLAGGLAVLMGLFNALQIKVMYPCYSALRQGVMVDLLSRLTDQGMNNDVRLHSITRLTRRFLADAVQATRVQATALHLWDSLNAPDTLTRDWLSFAALSHEIGMTISHNGYHKHGDYLMRFSDLAGFSSTEQAHIADLIQAQRGGLKKWQTRFDDVVFIQALVCLRLAVILCHARTDITPPNLKLKINKSTVKWSIDAAWRAQFPMSAYLLDEEAVLWQKMGFTVQ